MSYPIHIIDRSAETQVEPLGSKPKVWLDSGHILFKWDVRGTGVDWAEVIAAQLCQLLGLPHVDYEFAVIADRGEAIHRGVICPNIAPGEKELVLGNQLLLDVDSAYPSTQRCKVREHTVDAVCQALTIPRAPAPQWAADGPPQVKDALGFFVGYVMLDAWIANQDRHHENWGAIRDSAGADLRLAPTFDHGAGLACILKDNERHERLTTRDLGYTITAFCARAKSRFYGSNSERPNLTTLEAFRCFAAKAPVAAAAWIGRLRSVTPDAIWGILEQVPAERMTSLSRDFTCQLLTTNRERILEESPPT